MPFEPSTPIAAKARINPVAQYMLVLAAVIGAYSGYLKFAVPAIEGAGLVKEREPSTPVSELPSIGEDKSHLIPLLPADAWELTACTTLLIDAGTILYSELDRLEDGSLQIKPFTLIAGLNHASQGGSTQSSPPTVLRCLAGARLKFNKSLDELFSGNAKMESARLNGQVDIYRPPSNPDQNDAVHLATSNVQIDKHRVYTLEKVEFVFGSSRGSGRNLLIDLAHEDESSALIGFSSINGIRRLELAFLDKLRIEANSTRVQENAGVNNGNDAQSPIPGTRRRLFSDPTSPLEITCQGPFVFDFKSQTASFRNQVVAEQIDTFNDNIHCDELTLVFQDRSRQDLSPDPASILPKDSRSQRHGKINANLQLERFIAKGSPATVTSRSKSARISAENLSYTLLTNQFDGSCNANSQAMVSIVSPEYQMKSKQLRYRAADDGSLGEIYATGPGRLMRVGSPGQDDFYSAWERSLTTRNVPQQPGLMHVAIDGSAEVRIANETSILADRLEMLVWQIPTLTEDDHAKAQRSWEYLPAKLSTFGDVTIVSPQLDGQAKQLTATWLEQRILKGPPAERGAHRTGFRGTVSWPTNEQMIQSGSDSGRQLARIPRHSGSNSTFTRSPPQNGFNEPATQSEPSGFLERVGQAPKNVVHASNVQAVPLEQDTVNPSKTPKHKLKFNGKTVDIRLTGTGNTTEIRDLTVVGDVSILSTPVTATGVPQSLSITGHRLQLSPQPGEGNYRTLVSGERGSLARVSAKDFDLMGQNINLDQTANKLWVEGAGSLVLKPDFSRKPATAEAASQLGSAILRKSAPENLNVSWQGGMIFDGAKIYFEHLVDMSAEQTGEGGKKSSIQSQSEGLSVELSRPVQFQQLQSESKIGNTEIRELIFVDQVSEAQRAFKQVALTTVPQPSTPRPVVIQNRTYDASHQLSEQQKITVPKAIVNMESGSVTSHGPGTISVHRRGKPSTDSSSNPFGRLSGKGQAQNESGISFIQINFDGAMNVDTDSHEMELDGNIRTVYSPVQNWDQAFNPDNVLHRAPGRVLMTCERLLLAQWSPRAEAKQTSEIIATGNAHIKSDTFEATADRVSYDRSNDKLVIKGTQLTDANLLIKQTPSDKNPTQLVAKQITYRIKDQATATYGLEQLNLNRD